MYTYELSHWYGDPERQTPIIKSHLIGWKVGLAWIPPIENYQVDIIGNQVTTSVIASVCVE